MANELTTITTNGNLKRNIVFFGAVFGLVASGILILNYFQNRKFYAKQRELADLQEELIKLQVERMRRENGYQR